ncbi:MULTISPECIES: DinB family protein [Tenacibaculum]|uniref:DinB family protein n=1 Tax=Tenacibaculum TaxID=104267 RepID=UPI001F0A9EC4|nr:MULTISPECIES: DinB family protein [Tenacibaculum]MCH3882899.1 DinB family protein [Tenacibaculum aquimarinum]MCH3885530.1 DinB family protein [Tenacibaculum aquimarinum]MDO6600840.1 DinB family protein [Tenacibaculum sp. 1_MG-2023]
MKKESIINLLENKHQQLFNWLNEQPEDTFKKGPEGKWTTGQHIEHLVNSIQQLNNALSFPSFLLKYKFGTSNREVRTYDEVVKKYQDKLIVNQERARTFNINVKTPSEKKYNQLLSTLEIQNKKLQYKTQKLKDKNLDTLILPHPLMGKMPLREIIMWTAYHTEHHATILEEKHSSL